MNRDKDIGDDIRIRRLEGAAEAEWCARLMSASEPWITLKRGYDDSLRLLTSPTREVYLASAGEAMVGFTILIMSGAFVGFIQTIGVTPEWRNRGVGTRLVQFAEERIFKVSPNVFMCVSSFNKDARRLYERLGYEVVGELKDLIVRGHSEILLRKTLGPATEFAPADMPATQSGG
jgi:ribosomal-protein-alanine N-acetyltransferase